jgi:vancomycin resistance protein VanW
MGEKKLFCQRGKLCYQISLCKEYLLRDLHDLFSGERFAASSEEEPLPFLVQAHRSLLRRRLEGVDMSLQEGKIRNLGLALPHLHTLLIRPGETFSFWRRVGRCTAAGGYQPGLTITCGGHGSAVGGGLCQLANMVHWLVLHSELEVTELHHHTDALFPDSGRRVPFGTGTSIFYKNVDYRFQNRTEDTYQLLLWLDETDLCGELRCSAPPRYRYRMEEREHHFQREEDGFYYRVSQVWRRQYDRASGNFLREDKILQNHSRVLYDPALIPPEQIRQEGEVTE